MKAKIRMLLCMFVGIFGYCMLTFAQPSLEEQKVKIERWKREFKSLDRQYVQNHVLHNGGGLVAKLSKKNIPVNLPDGELCMKKRRQIGNWRKQSG